ncbi:hypothetical protein RAE21_13435 [Rhodoferax sp. TBRC 17198]|uniref:hypothetical protein n=1 Tax=Rhodoferax potami TaxID=3068338 RepID=UPI0028BD6CF7|nr:hypothetical protein [Rhodoferax sp. TBRC 17198]MDT7523394.1 hypothetical protein [Rhodoferax sp. TBRC 17198]
MQAQTLGATAPREQRTEDGETERQQTDGENQSRGVEPQVNRRVQNRSLKTDGLSSAGMASTSRVDIND